LLFAELEEMKDALMESNSENLELARKLDKNVAMVDKLYKDNERPEALQFYMERAMLAGT
jgi:hypothetical protein